MTRYVRMTMLAAALTTMTAGAAWAQVPPPTTPTPTPTPRSTEMTPAKMGMVEGTVKKVDTATGMLRVSSGPFGLFSKSIQVGPETRVTVDGRESNLSAIREGTKVKASYEQRNGQTVATRIEALPQGYTTRSSS
jgi:Cu/Ag efflux protein CusF